MGLYLLPPINGHSLIALDLQSVILGDKKLFVYIPLLGSKWSMLLICYHSLMGTILNFFFSFTKLS